MSFSFRFSKRPELCSEPNEFVKAALWVRTMMCSITGPFQDDDNEVIKAAHKFSIKRDNLIIELDLSELEGLRRVRTLYDSSKQQVTELFIQAVKDSFNGRFGESPSVDTSAPNKMILTFSKKLVQIIGLKEFEVAKKDRRFAGLLNSLGEIMIDAKPYKISITDIQLN